MGRAERAEATHRILTEDASGNENPARRRTFRRPWNTLPGVAARRRCPLAPRQCTRDRCPGKAAHFWIGI